MADAARRLGMSTSWFRALAKVEGITVARRSRQAGVDWTQVEMWIARSRIAKVHETLLRRIDPEFPIRGVELLDQVKAGFGWSDHDVADALDVWPSAVSRYRLRGVPDHQVQRLYKLVGLSPADVDPPRRLVPKRGEAGLPGFGPVMMQLPSCPA